jgi:ABC-type Mn2+/Zn2+ transport system ATPase subunit
VIGVTITLNTINEQAEDVIIRKKERRKQRKNNRISFLPEKILLETFFFPACNGKSNDGV